MEDLDDDFGDIYADVEAQASSAINAVSTFAHFEADEEEDQDHNQINGGEKPSCEASEEYSDSESEDDLNIVLNEGGNGVTTRIDDCDDEDDDEALVVSAKDSKYVWTQGSAYTSCGKATASVDTMPLGGDQLQNNRGRDAPNAVVTRNRYGFRLPWYRTILDVDVESFDEKSWRYPGVDMTDYFNFDLNEDSWKEYCKSVQQLRRVKSMQCGMPGSSKCYQEAISTDLNCTGSWTYAHPSSKVSDCRPIGKAIQIEDSIFERQPSFDSRHPRSWDSDVVIQISVQERTQEAANSSAECAHTDNGANQKSVNGEIDANGNQDDISYNTTNDEDSSLGSPEANLRTLDGCSKKINLSHQMTIDCDDHRNNQVIDVDGNHLKEVNGISLEVMELANKATEIPEGDISSADQCMMDTQLLLSDDELSLISSCFESDSEASRNSAPSDREDIHTPITPVANSQADNYGTPFTNSEGKRRRVDIRHHYICRSSSLKRHTHQGGRHTSIDGPSYHRNNDNDASPTSDTEDPTDWNFKEYSRGQKERLRGYGGRNRTYISNYKEPKMPCHYGIRNADIHDHNRREERKYSSPRSSHQLQPKLDPYANRSFDERRIFSEDTDSDWNHFGIARFTEEKSPLRSRESRGLHVRSSYTVGERDAQWRRNSNELLFKKIPNYRWHEDDFPGEKAGRCTSYTSRQRYNFDEFDERKLPPVRRQLNNWEQRGGHVGSRMYLNDSHSENFEDLHFNSQENRDVHRQSYRDLYEADDGSWNRSRSPRSDVLCPRIDERYRRHVRVRDVEESHEGNRFADHYDGYGIEDGMHDNNHLRWRRSNWGSEVMHWTEDQFNVRHHGDKVYSEKASCSYQKYARHDKFHVKYGTLSHEMQIDNMQPVHRRLTLPRKQFGANFVTRSAKMGWGKQEQLVRSRNSTDLAVREQKIPARFSIARNSMSNGNGGPANMGVKWNHNNKKRHDLFPGTARAPNADLDIEEGQIVAEEQNTTHTLQMKHPSDYTEPASSLKTKVIEAYDEQKILQTMAKMEQRGKRFKEPVSFKMEPDMLFTPEVDPTVETADETPHRPARKRRWGGRFSKNDSLMSGIPLKTRI